MSSATAVRASLVGESDGAGAAAGNCHVSGDMWSIDADRQRIGNSAFFDAAWSPKILAAPPAHRPNLAWELNSAIKVLSPIDFTTNPLGLPHAGLRADMIV